MRFLIVRRTPQRRELVGLVPERIEVVEAEYDDVADAVAAVRVPTGGDVRIAPMEHVTTVVAETLNRVVEPR